MVLSESERTRRWIKCEEILKPFFKPLHEFLNVCYKANGESKPLAISGVISNEGKQMGNQNPFPELTEYNSLVV